MAKKNLRTRFSFVEKLALGFLAGGIATATGYPFFRFMTYAGKKKDPVKKNRKKWFQLHHTTVNHPRYKHEEDYLATRAWCEAQEMEDVYTRSFDGLKLHAKYFPAEAPERIVLLCHGYRGTSFGSVAHMAEYLHENHTSLLFIDQRCCGESEGEYITFGAKEQHDILAWVRLLHQRNPEGLPIYLYGQSMGASTVLMASAHELPPEVKGIIADCGFHSMKQQLRDMAKGWFHFHWIGFLLLRVDLFCRLFAGFRMKDADTTAALESNTRPVLFFHGEEDTYVYPRNTEMNYRLCRAPKEVVTVPSARHLCSSYEAPDLYKNTITEFFRKIEHTN